MEKEYYAAQKIYNRMFVDKTKYKANNGSSGTLDSADKGSASHQNQLLAYINEYHRNIAKLNGTEYVPKQRGIEQEEEYGVEENLKRLFRKRKSVERCKS